MAIVDSTLAQELFIAVGKNEEGLTSALASEDQFMAAVAESLAEVTA